MNATARLIKRLRPVADIHAELDKMEAEIRAKAKRRNGKAGLAPGRSRAKRRRQGWEEAQAVRATVMERAKERCEVCGARGMVLELDHLASGSVRVHAVDACLAACADCHRKKHRNDHPTLRSYVAACLRLGLRIGHQQMARRLAKVERLNPQTEMTTKPQTPPDCECGHPFIAHVTVHLGGCIGRPDGPCGPDCRDECSMPQCACCLYEPVEVA